jgi:hypothetical protein
MYNLTLVNFCPSKPISPVPGPDSIHGETPFHGLPESCHSGVLLALSQTSLCFPRFFALFSSYILYAILPSPLAFFLDDSQTNPVTLAFLWSPEPHCRGASIFHRDSAPLAQNSSPPSQFPLRHHSSESSALASAAPPPLRLLTVGSFLCLCSFSLHHRLS